MTSVHRFIGNNRNVIRNAVLSALSVRPSTAYRQSSATRKGSGRVRMLGEYTGAEDATFDVEVVSDNGTNPQVSSPVFAGAGNGEISGVSVDAGVSAQTFAIRLVDLGTDTEAAAVEFYGVALEAITAGTAGNNITLNVDGSGLIYTATDYSLLEDLGAGTESVNGSQWDFGAKPLDSGGGIPADAPRLIFGDDPQVYRQYKVEVDGEWVYRFAPAIVRDVSAGTAVKTVSGGRTVTVSDGTTSEQYTGIITLYDLLDGIRRKSVLLTINGVVSSDRTPGGMGSRELPLRTSAYALPVRTAGTGYATDLDSVTVNSDAPTEQVEVECINDSTMGSEIWSVVGSLSGVLSDATTGQAYTGPKWGFTIPRKTISEQLTASINTVQELKDRTEGEAVPNICVDDTVLGVDASPKSITFTYTRRPEVDCSCDSASTTGSVSIDCLGLEEEIDVANLDPEYASRLTSLYEWREWFTRNNSWLIGGVAADRQLINSVTTTLANALASFYADTDARSEWDALFAQVKDDLYYLALEQGNARFREWEPDVDYVPGSLVMPSRANDNGHYYALESAGGAAGATEPAWPTNGSTVTDGAVTWKDMGLRISDTDYTATPPWQPGYDMGVNTSEWRPTDAKDNGHWYKSVLKGITGTTEPDWPTDGGSVTDGEVVWKDMGVRGWSATVALKTGDELYRNGRRYVVITAGTTGSAEPTWPASGTVVDGSVVWMCTGFPRNASIDMYSNSGVGRDADGDSTDELLSRYRATIDRIGLLVGIVPGKSDGASGSAACWSDPGDGYWWVPDGDYLPAFTNRVWHSAKRKTDGSIESTREFAFTIVCGCTSALKEGDKIRVTIGGLSGDAQTYKVGDKLILPIVAGSPLALEGGVDGNDTLTWQVYGSADGLLSEYTMTGGSGADYSTSGVHFTITSGGVPFELGDRFSFAVEGATWRWRKDGGSWSPASDITDQNLSLSDGVYVRFERGAEPSYVAGDLFKFTVRQPHAPVHLTTPSDEVYRWDGSGDTLTASLGSTQTIDTLVVARHTLPDGATVTVEGSVDGGSTWTKSAVLTRRDGVIAELLDTSWSVDTLRLVITGATGAEIGWWWAGEALSTENNADSVRLNRRYALSHGGGINPSAIYAGAGRGGEIAWQNWAGQTDLDNLLAMIAHAKGQGDEPVVFIPHYLHPTEAALVRVAANQIEIEDSWTRFQADDTAGRKLSVTLPLEGVIE